jgi:hypothetical protein
VSGFTGPNGAPLPPGVRISDADDGTIFVDTRVFPGSANVRATVTLAREAGTGAVLATVLTTNAGPGEANGVRLVNATLGGAASSTTLPQIIGRLIPEAPASTASRVFRFPATVGAAGTRAIISLRGTHSAGTFGTDLRVVLP